MTKSYKAEMAESMSGAPFTARIGRAPFHRARSASKKGTSPLLSHPSSRSTAPADSASVRQRWKADNVPGSLSDSLGGGKRPLPWGYAALFFTRTSAR